MIVWCGVVTVMVLLVVIGCCGGFMVVVGRGLCKGVEFNVFFPFHSPEPSTPKKGLTCSKMTSCKHVVGAKRAQMGTKPA